MRNCNRRFDLVVLKYGQLTTFKNFMLPENTCLQECIVLQFCCGVLQPANTAGVTTMCSIRPSPHLQIYLRAPLYVCAHCTTPKLFSHKILLVFSSVFFLQHDGRRGHGRGRGRES